MRFCSSSRQLTSLTNPCHSLKAKSNIVVILSDEEDVEMVPVAPAPSPSKKSPAKSKSPAKNRVVIELVRPHLASFRQH